MNAKPHTICENYFGVSGTIPRRTSYETGIPNHVRWSDASKSWSSEPEIMDERYLVARVCGKGLVVLTGCSHAGVINVCQDVQRAFGPDNGGDKIFFVAGGFHLAGASMETRIQGKLSCSVLLWILSCFSFPLYKIRVWFLHLAQQSHPNISYPFSSSFPRVLSSPSPHPCMDRNGEGYEGNQPGVHGTRTLLGMAREIGARERHDRASRVPRCRQRFLHRPATRLKCTHDRSSIFSLAVRHIVINSHINVVFFSRSIFSLKLYGTASSILAARAQLLSCNAHTCTKRPKNKTRLNWMKKDNASFCKKLHRKEKK